MDQHWSWWVHVSPRRNALWKWNQHLLWGISCKWSPRDTMRDCVYRARPWSLWILCRRSRSWKDRYRWKTQADFPSPTRELLACRTRLLFLKVQSPLLSAQELGYCPENDRNRLEILELRFSPIRSQWLLFIILWRELQSSSLCPFASRLVFSLSRNSSAY